MKEDDDIFHPGVSKGQVQRAEELLSHLSLEMFVEKRNVSGQMKPGVLVVPGEGAQKINVLASADIEKRPGVRALLTTEVLPRIKYAQLVIGENFRTTTLHGSVEPSHPGNRKDDQAHEKPLNVTLFHEQSD